MADYKGDELREGGTCRRRERDRQAIMRSILSRQFLVKSEDVYRDPVGSIIPADE